MTAAAHAPAGSLEHLQREYDKEANAYMQLVDRKTELENERERAIDKRELLRKKRLASEGGEAPKAEASIKLKTMIIAGAFAFVIGAYLNMLF